VKGFAARHNTLRTARNHDIRRIAQSHVFSDQSRLAIDLLREIPVQCD
jgi:hypothetical protein